MADLDNLKNRSKTLKSNLTRFQTFVTKTDREFQDNRIPERIRAEAQSRKIKLEPWLDEFESIQEQIQSLDESIDDDTINTVIDNFQTTYYEVLAALKDISGEKTNSVHSDTSSNNAESIADDAQSQNVEMRSNRTINKLQLQLPRIKLPIFSGQIEHWLNFRDMFASLIHNRDDLTEIEKYQYLKASLAGDAAILIQTIPLSAPNYQVAWDILQTRFENKPQIIHNHLKSLFELECIPKESHSMMQMVLNNLLSNMSSLKALGLPTEHWDAVIIYLMRTKLDPVTKREWEKLRSDMTELPTLNDFTTFLTKKCQLLESIQNTTKRNTSTEKSDKIKASHIAVTKTECRICKADHAIYRCPKFLEMSPSDRIKTASNQHLCKNCLRPNHKTNNCESSKCRKCDKKHNTLLHLETIQSNIISPGDPSSNSETTTTNASCAIAVTTQTFLPTALLYVIDAKGNQHQARVLLDSGSQANFVRRDLVKKLGLHANHNNVTITGINNSKSKSFGIVTLTVHSKFNAFKCKISCFILDAVTNNIPQVNIDTHALDIPSNVYLADPSFAKIGQIDILLGVEKFWSLICPEQISLGKRSPVLQNTLFGWVVSGPITQQVHDSNRSCLHTVIDSDQQIQNQIAKLWQIQEIPIKTLLTSEESECEEYFKQTTERNHEGRFIVKLPFKPDIVSKLGESYTIAKKRFFNIEKRFLDDPNIHQQYSAVIQEYISLGHMTQVQYNQDQLQRACFLPHHAVIRPDKNTTKVRVVFDASCKTNSGISLNNTLKVGPVVQSDLFTILLQFRLFPYAVSGDCEKMYRQILVHASDRVYQNILWRENKSTDLQTYQLNTVSFGTASAPYLATRCIQQIARENVDVYPEACHFIENSFYVDDFIASFESESKAIETVLHVNTLLSNYGFPMRKWTSNKSNILDKLPKGDTLIHLSNSTSCKTLGLDWEATDDTFRFPVKFNDVVELKVTKRTILSAISSIFDPLGLIGPIIVKSKIILQRLWQLNLSWDQPVPVELHTIWCSYYTNLSKILNITLPRQVLCNEALNIELHAFSDASEIAYGVCIYLRSTDSSGRHTVKLLCSKGRVAPLKTLTIPRLELMAAHLSSKLVQKIKSSLKLSINHIYYWCDSSIVLAWLKKHPSQLKTFVGHRVADIISDSDISNWFHVRSSDNPADLLSRGMSANQLSTSQLWWHGPPWLSLDSSSWLLKSDEAIPINLPELKPEDTSILATTIDYTRTLIHQLILRYSNLKKLQGVMAYILRYINNLNKNSDKRSGPLTVNELNESHNVLIKQVQSEVFDNEIKILKLNKNLAINHHLTPLNPFIDKEGILRVGGRIKHSNMPYDVKHPILLPTSHPYTDLVIWYYHRENLHAGADFTLSASRQIYWIISGKRATSKITKSCVKCRRYNAKPIEPIMGDLPKDRVQPSRPFSICGTDFAEACFTKVQIYMPTSYKSQECALQVLVKPVSRSNK